MFILGLSLILTASPALQVATSQATTQNSIDESMTIEGSKDERLDSVKFEDARRSPIAAFTSALGKYEASVRQNKMPEAREAANKMAQAALSPVFEKPGYTVESNELLLRQMMADFHYRLENLQKENVLTQESVDLLLQAFAPALESQYLIPKKVDFWNSLLMGILASVFLRGVMPKTHDHIADVVRFRIRDVLGFGPKAEAQSEAREDEVKATPPARRTLGTVAKSGCWTALKRIATGVARMSIGTTFFGTTAYFTLIRPHDLRISHRNIIRRETLGSSSVKSDDSFLDDIRNKASSSAPTAAK